MQKSRQLSAIMFTDIQGYTKLMQTDEKKGVAFRERHREIFNRITEKHNGKILQYYGDGTLSVFDSAVAAVQCGIDMQKEFLQDPFIPIRIGIHSGDIIYTEDDIIGDSVNVTKRIESLGIPGAVLLSEKIFDEIKNQDGVQVQSLGYFAFKNVGRPMEVYAISNDGLRIPEIKNIKSTESAKWVGASFEDQKEKDQNGKWSAILLPIAIGIVLFIAGFLTHESLQFYPTDKLVIEFPYNQRIQFPNPSTGAAFAISPERDEILISSRLIYKYDIKTGLTSLIEGDYNAGMDPIYSPDGSMVAFFGFQKGKLKVFFYPTYDEKKMNTCCDLTLPKGGYTWIDNSKIFLSGDDFEYQLIHINDGKVEDLNIISEGIYNPSLIPGTNWIIASNANFEIFVFDYITSEIIPLGIVGWRPKYTSNGFIYYANTGRVLAVPFDLKSMKVTGEPKRIVEKVNTDLAITRYRAQFDISSDGKLFAYDDDINQSYVKMVSRNINTKVEKNMPLPWGEYGMFSISPDKKKMAIGTNDIKKSILVRGISVDYTMPISFGESSAYPIWSPDGSSIAFSSKVNGNWEIIIKSLETIDPYQKLTETNSNVKIPTSWTKDGHILFYELTSNGSDLYKLDLSSKEIKELIPNTSAYEGIPTVSPNNDKLAFITSESGKIRTIVTQYPNPKKKVEVNSIGYDGRWNSDGSQLFYRFNQNFFKIDVSDKLELSNRKWLFADNYLDPPSYSFDLLDDEHLVLLKRVDETYTRTLTLLTTIEAKTKAAYEDE